MKVVVCDHKDRELLETVLDVIRSDGHTVTELIDADPRKVYDEICKLAERPDKILTDLAHEPDELDKPVRDLWGSRLIRLLRGDCERSAVTILVRSRYLAPEDRAYLVSLGIDPKDILSPYSGSLQELLVRIRA